MGPFEIEGTHISRLRDFQLTQLLKRLLHLEADEFGMPRSASEVPLEINVPDGGDDGFIQWEGGLDELDFIRNRFTMFQCKSGKTKMKPRDFRMEMLVRVGDKLKDRVKDVLDAGGCYAFFLGFACKASLQKTRIEACRKGLRSLNRVDAESADIRIYDAGKIADWVNKYFAAQVFVRSCTGCDVPWGLKTWEDWAGHDDYRFSYVTNVQLGGYVKTIRDYLCSTQRPVVRLTGLSGLGKTRLAMETFRSEDGTSSVQLQALQNKVVYFDASNGGGELVDFIADTRSSNVKVLLVVDNCEHSLHERFVKESGYHNRNIGLLTVDFNPEKINPDYRCIYLTRNDCKGVVKGILKEVYPGLGVVTISRIEEFAQDFPSIAVLLAKQVESGLEEIGQIQNKEIVKKLLWGREPEDEEIIKILTACSLVDYFEFSTEDYTDHLKFLSKEIAEVKEQKFYETCLKYKERGILQCRGRYMRVSPIPLAITLAADWWSKVPRKFAKSIIDNVAKAGLTEQFCEQMRNLQFSPNVRELTEELCGNTGPFGNPEVLLSEEGSRLFRALVEVNPQATTQALFSIMNEKSQVDLLQIKDNIRRNLVWAIERLCWWKDTFPRASKMMLALALTENETWSNNATGQFLQLFHVYLPGTEADLKARLQVIVDGLESQVLEERKLAIKALGSALDTGGFSRGAGADTQGSRLPRRDYEPKGQEIYHYWHECIGLLKNLIIESAEFSELAASELAMQIRELISNGMIDEIEAAIKAVVGARGQYWPEALVAVRHSLDYDTEQMPLDIQKRLKSLEKMLLPESLEKRLRLVVSIPDWRDIQDENGDYISIAEKEAEKLAEELSCDTSWYDKVEIILKGEQRQICAFGVKLGQLIKNPKKFIDACLDSLEHIPEEEASPEVIGYFLRGLSDNSLVSKTMERIISHEKLVFYTVRITRCIEINEEHLRRLIPLIKEDKVPITDFEMFSSGRALDKVPPDFVMEFCEEIARHSVKGSRCALHVLYMYCYRNEPRFNLCAGQFRKLVMMPNLLYTERKNSLIVHNWEVVCNKLLSEDRKDEELSKYLTKEIMKMCVSRDAYHSLPTRNAKVVLGSILKNYFDNCWPIVGEGLLDKESGCHLSLRRLLGTGHEKEKPDALVTDLPEEKIIEWCKQNEPEGPTSIAGLMPVFSGEEPVSWHPFAKRIIDEFGRLDQVLNALISNLVSFPSAGSRAPYYERRVMLLNSLLVHEIDGIRQWSQSGINYFTKQRDDAHCQDEEWQWGIH